MMSSSNAQHEQSGHLLLEATMPFKVVLPETGERMTLSAAHDLPLWLREGSANIIAGRYIHNWKDFKDFWLTIPAGDIPAYQIMLDSNMRLSYLYYTIFSGAILQMIGETYTYKIKKQFPTHPNHAMMLKGYFLLIEIANKIENNHQFILPEKPGKEIGQLYIEHLLIHLSRLYNFDIPSFDELCKEFDAGKAVYWKNWQKVFQPE